MAFSMPSSNGPNVPNLAGAKLIGGPQQQALQNYIIPGQQYRLTVHDREPIVVLVIDVLGEPRAHSISGTVVPLVKPETVFFKMRADRWTALKPGDEPLPDDVQVSLQWSAVTAWEQVKPPAEVPAEAPPA